VRSPSLSRLAAGLSAGVLALGLAACGGNSTTSAGSAPTSSTAGSAAAGTASSGSASASGSDTAGTTVTATEADFSIALSSSTLPAGTYTFTVKNAGKATHSLTVEGPGGVDMTSDTVQGGQSTTMTVTLQPGTYDVYCPIGNHRGMGMETTLTVR
jgi:plastocyanin